MCCLVQVLCLFLDCVWLQLFLLLLCIYFLSTTYNTLAHLHCRLDAEDDVTQLIADSKHELELEQQYLVDGAVFELVNNGLRKVNVQLQLV